MHHLVAGGARQGLTSKPSSVLAPRLPLGDWMAALFSSTFRGQPRFLYSSAKARMDLQPRGGWRTCSLERMTAHRSAQIGVHS